MGGGGGLTVSRRRLILWIEADGHLVAECRNCAAVVEPRWTFHHAPTLEDAQSTLATQGFDDVLIDVRMQNGKGADFLTDLAREHHSPRRAVLSHDLSAEEMILMQARSTWVAVKPVAAVQIVALLRAMESATPPSEESGLREFARWAGLSARQSQVFLALLDAKGREEVADSLDCSPNTVHQHIKRICQKVRAKKYGDGDPGHGRPPRCWSEVVLEVVAWLSLRSVSRTRH